MATDFLDQTRDEIAARIGELRPLVAEYERLQAAAVALDGIPRPGAPARRQPSRAPASPASPSSGAATGARRGRPKGSGKRGEQALAVITAHPGITVSELAEKMGIKQNYLYRVLPGLAAAQRVRKEGRGWHPQPSA
jgi:hypothetical protein